MNLWTSEPRRFLSEHLLVEFYSPTSAMILHPYHAVVEGDDVKNLFVALHPNASPDAIEAKWFDWFGDTEPDFINPMEPDYETLARVEPTSQVQDSMDCTGWGQV